MTPAATPVAMPAIEAFFNWWDEPEVAMGVAVDDEEDEEARSVGRLARMVVEEGVWVVDDDEDCNVVAMESSDDVDDVDVGSVVELLLCSEVVDVADVVDVIDRGNVVEADDAVDELDAIEVSDVLETVDEADVADNPSVNVANPASTLEASSLGSADSKIDSALVVAGASAVVEVAIVESCRSRVASRRMDDARPDVRFQKAALVKLPTCSVKGFDGDEVEVPDFVLVVRTLFVNLQLLLFLQDEVISPCNSDAPDLIS
ncbi:hypothetical protein B0A50_00269 [Salinomyces thailandicus]|uniref:Uncharacterized protein n=1 Tax=Salinomyces thailandicus TaxID=706561 RepID=A0A4V5N667_9PEZI|nr:hypothetical protein B0A50_00269 [Salinomyces thailandica]